MCGIFTARKPSLGQGNIFTPVCHSVQGGGVCMHWESVPREVCTREGGSASRGGQTPHWILRDTVNERALRILLECILVFFTYSKMTRIEEQS